MRDFFFSHTFQSINVDAIRPADAPLRLTLTGIEELAHSLSNKGLLNPIVVRSIGSEFEIICGHRRFMAARQLRWSTIPCHIMELSDQEAYELALADNIQHNSLNMIEEAEAYRRFIEEYGWGGVSQL